MKEKLRKILISIVSIILIISIVFIIFIFNMKKIINKSNIEDIASTTKITKIKLSNNESVEDIIKNYNSENDLSQKYIDSLINTPKFQELFNETVAGLFDYAIYGNEIPYITSKEIEESIDYEKIEDNLNVRLTDTDKQKISSYSKDASSKINSYIEKYVEEFDDNKETNKLLKFIRLIFSTEFKIYEILTLCILIFILCLLLFNWKKIFKPFGIIFIVSGLILSILSYVLNFGFLLFNNDNEMIKFAIKIVNQLKSKNIIFGIVFIIGGTIFVVIHRILKITNKKR